MAIRTETLTQIRQGRMMRQSMKQLRKVLLYAALIGGAAFFLFPLVWMVGTSLKTLDEVGRSQLHLLPEVPQWVNYQDQLEDSTFWRSYFNSVFIVTVVLFGTISSVSLVAFSFSRLEWKGRGVVFALMMSTLMLPYQATLVPQYVMFNELDWIRTFNPITLPGFFGGGAALIFLLRQFMLTIPKELDEAAMIDGANPLQIFWQIVMPLSRPAIATITVFLFVGQWNNLLLPLIYLQKPQLYTMPIYVAQKLNLNEAPLRWHDVMAASVLFVIPVLVVFMLTQRYFIEGIATTGSKG